MAAITTAVIGGVGLAGSIHQGRQNERAADRALRAQQQAGREAIESQESAALRAEELSRPFTEFGASQLGALQGQLAQPTQEQEFAQLQQNPIFQAALNRLDRQALGGLSVGGRVGSGDQSAILSENLLLAAGPLLAQQRAQRQQGVQNLFGAARLGQASAVGQAASGLSSAANIGNLQTQVGNVNAAGTIAQQRVRGKTTRDVISQLPGLLGSLSFTQ